MIADGRAEKALLEKYEMALTNVAQPQIAAAMALYGYDATKITEGRDLLASTNTEYDSIYEERNEESQAYAVYLALHQEVVETYSIHRKLAKVAFREDHMALAALRLTGQTPRAYIKWLATVSIFYRGLLNNEAYLKEMELFMVTPSVLSATQAKVSQMEAARTKYQLEKGESQDTTQIKDDAFAEMDSWMSAFYSVARIALRNHPQLLVSLDKFKRA